MWSKPIFVRRDYFLIQSLKSSSVILIDTFVEAVNRLMAVIYWYEIWYVDNAIFFQYGS